MTLFTAWGDVVGGAFIVAMGAAVLAHRTVVTRFFNAAGKGLLGASRADRIYTSKNVGLGAWAFVVGGGVCVLLGIGNLIFRFR